MSMTPTENILRDALQEIEDNSEVQTDGKYLERLTVETAPSIHDWNIAEAWRFEDWVKQESIKVTQRDLGIDVVAKTHDGHLIAIQCKSRMKGGTDIPYDELSKFFSVSQNSRWRERWVIVNLDAGPNGNARAVITDMDDRKPRFLSLRSALVSETERRKEAEDAAAETGEQQSKDALQSQVVDSCVVQLRKLQMDVTDGSPVGEARGRLILPCGTGKTRISLRIVERLAPGYGDISVVLCPSIALVAQIRQEYSHHAKRPLNALAVCSDPKVADPTKAEEAHARNPNIMDDSGFLSVTAMTGQVTTKPEEISEWMESVAQTANLNVIFGTYQSAHRIAEALRSSKKRLQVMVCDEAHRTAGIQNPRDGQDADDVRKFTLCHNSEMFPANFRLYQTATPRIFDAGVRKRACEMDMAVRDMDDQATFGPELERRSFREAVENGWLSDYRIIAIAVNDEDIEKQANRLASEIKVSKSRIPLGVPGYTKGLAFALAMAGEVKSDGDPVSVASCISFLNTIASSKAMVKALTDDSTVKWLEKRIWSADPDADPAKMSLEHLDASSNVTAREEAKTKLRLGTGDRPHAVFNVGIFGEGTDAPSLSAVSFLEPRKSPTDVVQAVGRVMRTAPGKKEGYIIVPITVPKETVAEEWLMNSSMDEGWQELGQVLGALRAHDSRIEEELPNKLKLLMPDEPESVVTLMAVQLPGRNSASRFVHTGKVSDANRMVERLVRGEAKSEKVLELKPVRGVGSLERLPRQPTRIVTARTWTGTETPEIRVNTVPPLVLEMKSTPEKRNRKLNETLHGMLNGKGGNRLRRRKETGKRKETEQITLFDNPKFAEFAKGIHMNLLEKSGIGEGNRVRREANVLISHVRDAARYLKADGLDDVLAVHLGMQNVAEAMDRGDPSRIASLVLLNAAMLHQRIAEGGWLENVRPLSELKTLPNPAWEFLEEWETIRRIDFVAVIQPAAGIIECTLDTGKTAGLTRALRSVSESAEEIAALYADMGIDHAGEIYNAFMSNQDSDGAFFTRPQAATLLAGLAIDACGDLDWSADERILDPACGSGTLLNAAMREILRRSDGKDGEPAELRRNLVENGLVGLDINPVSLQLAASQLTAGTTDVRYRRMGLHLMPYGPKDRGGGGRQGRIP